MENEIWKIIPNHEEYEASTIGRVRKSNYRNTGKPLILKPYKRSNGYLQLRIFKNGVEGKTIAVHRLVAKAFIPNPKNKPQVNHINAVKYDNRVENLEWCTSMENNKHRDLLGLGNYVNGEQQGSSKLKEEEVLQIRELYDSGELNISELHRKFNVSRRNIRFIVQRKSWKHLN
jgi:hypothetical protein